MSAIDDLLTELFAPLGGVSLRRMFGGLGVFKEGLMFGLVSQDVLYLKANDASKAPYEAEGFGRWVYPGMKKAVAMPYWQVPDRLFDEPEEFTDWARSAFEVAVANRAAKTKPANKIAKAAKKAVAKPKKVAAPKAAKAAKTKPSRKPAKRRARA